ncbi:unnamed protein product [Boreogadus saida]
MTEFWLISAPGEKTCQQSWDKMMMATTHTTNLSTNNKFNIPDLKVGTLDVLVGLSDELTKLDTFVESLLWANKEVETFVCILGEEDVVYDVYVAAAVIDIRPTTKGPMSNGGGA